MATINTWPGWRMVRRIGAGSFGTVYEIETTENGVLRKAALKVMSVPPSPEDVQDIYDSGIASTQEDVTTYISSQIANVSQEFKVMAALRGNPNIVTFEDHMIIPHEGWVGADILIRMELLTPLNRYLRDHTLTENDIIRVGTDMCNALETCHAKVPPILHRDIKAANIMVDDQGRYKLGDFGVARVMEGTKSAHTKAGTEDHMAPEVVQMQGYRATADLYSLGIVLYRLLNNNRNPFLPVDGSLTENMQMQARAWRLSGQPVPPPRDGSPALQAVVLKALSYLPQNRYQTASEMRAALEQCRNAGSTEAGAAFGQTVNMWQQGTGIAGTQGSESGTVVLDTPGQDGFGNVGGQGSESGTVTADNSGQWQNPPQDNGTVVIQDGAAPKKKSKLPIILAAAVVVLVVAVGALLAGGGGSGSTSHSTSSSQSSQSSQSSGSSAVDENDFDTIEILTDSLTILEGDTMLLRLKAGSWGLDGQSKGITWTSSDPDVADFTSDGVLEAYMAGSFTVTAEYEGVTTTGDMTVVSVDDSYGATVSADPESVSITQGDQTDVQITFGGTLPDSMSALAYDSAGMSLAVDWGTVEDNKVTMTISDLFSANTDGMITVLVYDKNDPTHVVAAQRIPVHIGDYDPSKD